VRVPFVVVKKKTYRKRYYIVFSRSAASQNLSKQHYIRYMLSTSCNINTNLLKSILHISKKKLCQISNGRLTT